MPASNSSRRTTSRTTTGCSTPLRWSGPCQSATAGPGGRWTWTRTSRWPAAARRGGGRGAELDEPCLALDRTAPERAAFLRAYRFLAERVPKAKILVATYFAGLGDNFPTALELPVAGLHLDAVRLSSASGNGASQLDALLQAWPAGGGSEGQGLSLGVIGGGNIWEAGLSAVLRQLAGALERARAAQL